MKLITPTFLIYASAWSALAAIAVAVFSTGYRRRDRHLMVMGFVLSGATGALLDYVIQMIRLVLVFG